MADLSGLVLTVLGVSFDLASTLYSYAKDVKEAKNAIQQLSNELYALIGVLEHLKRQQEQPSLSESKLDQSEALIQSYDESTLTSILSECLDFLHGLQKSLKIPTGRLRSALHKLKWPLKDSDMKGHLRRLERVKTYFILALVTDDFGLTREIASQIFALGSLVCEDTEEKRLQKTRDQHRSIAQWLSPVNADTIRTKLASQRVNGSGTWFIDNGVFQNWVESHESTILWLNGITGAGKSTLMTTAVERLLALDGVGERVAYFYCSFSDSASLDPTNILGSMLAQLCKPTSSVYAKIEVRHDSDRDRKFTADELTDLLIEVVQEEGSVYIFLDAVNECGDPVQILSYMRRLSAHYLKNTVHILLSSINEGGIDDCIEGFPCWTVATLLPRDMSDDIELLVWASIDKSPRLRKHSKELKEEIAETLTQGAQGMFRWVQCQLERLAKLKTQGAIHDALTTLPLTLDRTYEDMLCRIDFEDKQFARDILELLSYALMPMNLNRICEFLQITLGMAVLDHNKKLTDPKDVLSICGSLLSYQYEGVTLAHHSVKTYLESNLQGSVEYFKVSEIQAHHSLAWKCLNYLSMDAFSDGPCASRSLLKERMTKFPFLRYAAENWTNHMNKIPTVDGSLWTALRAFLFSTDTGRGNFRSWIQIMIPSSRNIQTTPPLYYVASYGILPVVRYLLDEGVSTEIAGGRCSATPINIAAFRGHADVVKLLLEHGADPLAIDDRGCSAVDWARNHKRHIVLEVLASAGYATSETLTSDDLSAFANGNMLVQSPYH
ncbi:hypothetical protein MMC17_006727 [Xylographa soralifera]|nr:hypothetical protein [Xylographa soralifera]